MFACKVIDSEHLPGEMERTPLQENLMLFYEQVCTRSLGSTCKHTDFRLDMVHFMPGQTCDPLFMLLDRAAGAVQMYHRTSNEASISVDDRAAYRKMIQFSFGAFS